MQYTCLGQNRLTFGFPTPNQAGCFFVLCVFLLATGAAVFLKKKSRLSQTAGNILVAIIPICLLAIVLTYSRGSYVAMLGSGMLLSCFLCIGTRHDMRQKTMQEKHLVRSLIFMPLLFSTLIVIIPAGYDRLKSSSRFHEGSISNRLDLWRGGAILMILRTKQKIQRVKDPGVIYAQWLQPLHKHEHYRTLISDFMTISVRYGVMAGFLFLFLFCCFVLSGITVWRRTGHLPALFLSMAILSFMICGGFSTMHENAILLVLPLASMVAIITTVPEHPELSSWKRMPILMESGGIAFVFSLGLCTLTYGYGSIQAKKIPWKLDNVFKPLQESMEGIDVKTANQKTGEAWIFLDEPHPMFRKLALPLATRGFDVHLHKNSGGMDGMAAIMQKIKIHDGSNGNCLLIAIGENQSNAAYGAIAALPDNPLASAIFVNLRFSHPNCLLSPERLPPQGHVILCNTEAHYIEDGELEQYNRYGYSCLNVQIGNLESALLQIIDSKYHVISFQKASP